MTHGQKTTGAGGTAAGSRVKIGNSLTLPAGGPWLVHGVWIQAVQDTAVASEAINGNLIVNAKSGDINPDPAPGKYPANGMSSQVSANFGIHATPLNIFDVNWLAAGKAIIDLEYENLSGNASAPLIAAGILYGDAIPEKRPLVFCDSVGATLSTNVETSIGSITLAEKATKIVGIMATAMKDGAVVVDEAMLATIRLDSSDVKFTPGEFPCGQAYNAADGVPAGGTGLSQNQFIPLDIPVIGGSIIQCFGSLVNAVTNGLDISVYIAYE